jgi:hypothetical protein
VAIASLDRRVRAERVAGRASERVVRVSLVLAVVAVAVQTVAHVVNAAVGGGSYLNVNSERNPTTWAHSATIFAAAFLAGTHAAGFAARRATFVVVAAILVFLSIDEMLLVHERIFTEALDLLDLPVVWDSVIWPVIYIPILGVLAGGLLVIARSTGSPGGGLVLLALALLGAAVVIEIVTAPFSVDDRWPHDAGGAVEEGAELAGWLLLAAGLAAITLDAADGAAGESGR